MMEGFEKSNWDMIGGWIIGLFALVVFIWIIVEIKKRYSNADHKTAEDIFKERNVLLNIKRFLN